MNEYVGSFRSAFTLSGSPAWGYGLLCGGAICAPLLAGTFTGRITQGAAAALGAYLVVFADDFMLPYGARARRLLRSTVFVTLGTGLGGLVSPYPWAAAVVIALVAAVGAHWTVIGVPPTLAVILSYFQGQAGVGTGVVAHMVLAAAGGLWITVVVLLAWPVRRLEPLRDAFTAAGLAVAALLEAGASASDDDWEESRREAEEALAAARTAVAHFRAVEQEEEESDDPTPGRLLNALTRIFHETVALRLLRGAIEEITEDTDWSADLDAATQAAASALREALERNSALAVPAALAAGARFADRASAIRRAALARHEPLAAAALISQVRRCVNRIGVAVRSAALLSVEGVAVTPRLPRLPRPAWRRPGPRAADHPARLALVAFGAMALMVLTRAEYGKWFVATVVANLRPTYGDTVERVVFPVVGTAAGAVAGAVVLALAPGHLTLSLFVGGCAVLGYALRPLSFPWWMLFATPLSLLLADFARPLGWDAAMVRVGLTVAGGAVVFLAARWLWPRGERVRLADRIAGLLEAHAELVRALVEQRPDEVRERVKDAARSEQKLTESLDRLEKEPGGGVPESMREAVIHAQRVRDDALALFAVPRPDDESGPTAAVLDAVADRLESAATSIRSGKPLSPPDDLDEALDAMASHVETLTEQRLDEVAEGAAEEWTAIRYAYTHAAAAHPALEALVADVVRLCRAVC
ncbi:FUSC family protein [Streptosporangium sp. KLBMP 9127]|nr:FUSC family protein [Streptosporangium sp. KLBMP 9127]